MRYVRRIALCSAQTTVTETQYEGLLVQVAIDVGGQTITSIITSDAARSLGLKKGVSVYALIEATEVMIYEPDATS